MVGRPQPSPASGATGWRAQRLLERVEPAVEAVVAHQATTYWNRGAKRSAVAVDGRTRVSWTIDGDHVVDLEVGPRGPARVTVHDVGLLQPLQRSLRTRRVVVGLA